MTTCIFTPTHDPWSCTVHSGGYRSSLQQDRCRVEPLSPAEVEEFDRWAEGRQSKGVSLGMLWALRLRATIAAGVTLDPSPAPDTALRARISLEAINGIRPVWIGEGVFEQYAARTAEGWPVTIEWGEPDADGFYSPTFTEHLDAERAARAGGEGDCGSTQCIDIGEPPPVPTPPDAPDVRGDNQAALEALPYSVQGADLNLPQRVVVDKHGHYWRDYGAFSSMCPVSDENDETVVVAAFTLDPSPIREDNP